MAVLQKIRVKFGLAISIIIALALLSFIIDPSTLESALNMMSSKYDVGVIDGKKVTYTDFQENIDKFTTIHQISTGSSVQNEQAQQQIRNAAWQDFIDRYMFIKNAKNAGIRVGEDEVVDLTTGSNISPVLANNPAFADETGAYSPEVLREFISNVNNDETGRLKTFWNYLQNSVMVQKYYDKYGDLFTAAAGCTPKVILDRYIAEGNTTADVEYVTIPLNYNDSTVTVSNKEIQAYYKSHKEDYKQAAGRDIEYVVFEVVPSSSDITATSDEMESLVEEFASINNVKAFLLRNSERSYSEHWYKPGELRTVAAEIDDYVFSGAQAVSPVYRKGNVFRSVKTIASANVPDSVYVKHILLQGTDAKHLADSLCGVVAKGGNFSGLAALYSVDKSSAADGELGNLGWFTQNYMIPGFESVMTSEIGKPFVLNTQYGSHVVLVTKRTKPVAKKQVAILEKSAIASKETFNDFYGKANRFATIANGTYEGYQRAVDSTGVYSHPMSNVTEATANYGSVSNAKEITRWVFDAKKGKASNIITVNNNFFFVVALKDVREEGYKSVEEMAPVIRTNLSNVKYREATCAEVAAKVEGMTDLAEIAAKLDAPVSNASDVAFLTKGIPAVEPALLGAVANAPEGQVCGPVAGETSVYMFKVSNRQTGSFYTKEDLTDLENQKAAYVSRSIVPTMMENGNVKDNRARFF